jgi:hypothetical protein
VLYYQWSGQPDRLRRGECLLRIGVYHRSQDFSIARGSSISTDIGLQRPVTFSGYLIRNCSFQKQTLRQAATIQLVRAKRDSETWALLHGLSSFAVFL